MEIFWVWFWCEFVLINLYLTKKGNIEKWNSSHQIITNWNFLFKHKRKKGIKWISLNVFCGTKSIKVLVCSFIHTQKKTDLKKEEKRKIYYIVVVKYTEHIRGFPSFGENRKKIICEAIFIIYLCMSDSLYIQIGR